MNLKAVFSLFIGALIVAFNSHELNRPEQSVLFDMATITSFFCAIRLILDAGEATLKTIKGKINEKQ